MELREVLDASTTARICADGSLVAEVRAARVGIQQYLGREVDPENQHGLRDKAVVNVYRPEAEVFNRDSMASFAAAPFTIDHPSQPVDAANWKQLASGEVNGDVVRDGDFVRVPLIVRDAKAVDQVNTTHKQLSMGYACQLAFPTDGKHPDGTVCDAYQTNIRINHIAAVKAARGGPELKISDERAPIQEVKHMKKIVLDGLQVDLSDADAVAAAINKLQADNATQATKLADAETKLAAAVTESATKDAEITTLKKAVEDAKVTPEQMLDAAKAYASICDKAKALGVKFDDNASADAIMKAAVSAKMGDAAKDWTTDQIAASFAVLSADVKHDPLRAALADGVTNVTDISADVDATRKASLAAKSNAYRAA